MEDGRIIIIEDNPLLRRLLTDQLVSGGHTVVAEADNLPDALSLVGRLAGGKIEADAIVLDGNFPDHGDAGRVGDELRRRNVGAWTIGMSMDRLGDVVDVDVGKRGTAAQLLEALSQLPKPGQYRDGLPPAD